MKKSRTWLYILIGIVLLFGIYGAISFNSFIKKEETVVKYWADVERTYQRRADLIPSLVATVGGMAGFEKKAMQDIAEARANLSTIKVIGGQNPSPENLQMQLDLEIKIAANANRLIAVIEDYPNLRGTEGFLGLQAQLEGTERRIKIARQDYNKAVEIYNVSVRQFPSNIVANLAGFSKYNGFAADPGAEKAIEIKFNQ